VRLGLVERAEDYRYSSVRIWNKRPLEDEPLSNRYQQDPLEKVRTGGAAAKEKRLSVRLSLTALLSGKAAEEVERLTVRLGRVLYAYSICVAIDENSKNLAPCGSDMRGVSRWISI
jgi:hypothetical protein